MAFIKREPYYAFDGSKEIKQDIALLQGVMKTIYGAMQKLDKLQSGQLCHLMI